MITVEIKINDYAVRTIHAHRVEEFTVEDKEYTYDVFIIDNSYEPFKFPKEKVVGLVKHKYSDGAVALAEKLLPFMRNSKGK